MRRGFATMFPLAWRWSGLAPRRRKPNRGVLLAQPRWRVVPVCEPLESRLLLSLTPTGSEFRVNTTTSQAQQTPAVAADGAGNFVVAWQGNGPGDADGIVAQRFSAAGVASGGEIQVNTSTIASHSNPAVAMDADGDFVVVFDTFNSANSSIDVFARRFNAAGVAQGATILVNTYVNSTQRDPAVALDPAGNFVVVWTSFGQDGSSYGIYAQRYNAAGTAQGTEFRVNQTTAQEQDKPVVATDATGRFVVAWESTSQDGSFEGIVARRFDASGLPLGDELVVNGYTTNGQRLPGLDVDAAGNFAIAWQSSGQDGSGLGVYARRYDSAGVAQGGEFQVNTTTTGDQAAPVVALDSGALVIAWQSSLQDGSGQGIYGQCFTSAGVATGGEVRLNTYTSNDQAAPALVKGLGTSLVAVWQSTNQDGSLAGVYGQRYGAPISQTTVTSVRELASGEPVTEGGIAIAPVTSVVIEFSQPMSTAGGTSGASSATNPNNYSFYQNNTLLAGLVGSVSYVSDGGGSQATLVLSQPLPAGLLRLVVSDSLLDSSGQQLDGDNNGAPGGAFVRNFTVVVPPACGEDVRVDTSTMTRTTGTAVAVDADGDFVVVWQQAVAATPNSMYNLYARRYRQEGVPLGAPIQVTTAPFTTVLFDRPGVAMDADGDFGIVWSEFDASLSTSVIYGRRFDSQGAAQGNKFAVSSSTGTKKVFPVIASDAAGNLTAVWQAAPVVGGSTFDIFMRRFDAAGTALTGEVTVNTYTTSSQVTPALAMNPDGAFVVVWPSTNQSGSFKTTLQAQRFSATGSPLGSEFKVSEVVRGEESRPSAAMRPDGSFVVTWAEIKSAAESQAYVRRFGPTGTPEGSAVLVTSHALIASVQPRVSLDGDGGFAVFWSKPRGVANTADVFGQRFQADGSPLDSSFQINDTESGYAFYVDAAAQPSGYLITVWDVFSVDPGPSPVYFTRFCPVTPALLGDANGDCQVGAADYALWAAQFAMSGTGLSADFDRSGEVGAADYALWAANFGKTCGVSATTAAGLANYSRSGGDSPFTAWTSTGTIGAASGPRLATMVARAHDAVLDELLATSRLPARTAGEKFSAAWKRAGR